MVVPADTRDEFGFFRSERSSPSPLLLQMLELLLGGESSSTQQEKHRLRERLITTVGFLRLLDKLRDRVSSEGDSVVGVKRRTFPEHGWQSSHAHDGIVNLDILDNSVAVLLAKVHKF